MEQLKERIVDEMVKDGVFSSLKKEPVSLPTFTVDGTCIIADGVFNISYTVNHATNDMYRWVTLVNHP